MSYTHVYTHVHTHAYTHVSTHRHDYAMMGCAVNLAARLMCCGGSGDVRCIQFRPYLIGHNYIGHNCFSHNFIGHGYSGHTYAVAPGTPGAYSLGHNL